MKGVPFSVFMSDALYGDFGYYMTDRNRFGRRGDFYTSAQVSPVFGRLLALQILREAPFGEPLSLVEIGCGDGDLAVALLQGLASFSEENRRIRYAAIDRSQVSLTRTRERLTAFSAQCADCRVEWSTFASMEALLAYDLTFRGAFLIGNEVLDALPCELINVDLARISDPSATAASRAVREGRMIENQRIDGTPLEIAYTGEPCREASVYAKSFVSPLVRSGHLPKAGVHHVEVPIAYRSFLQSIANTLSPREMILLDYGGETADVIAADRPRGSLRGYQHHRLVDPLSSPGDVDITYDVDFSYVREILEEVGYVVDPLTRQGSYLMGIISRANATQHVVSESEYGALKHLVMPGGLGDRFVVCVAHRDKEAV